MAIIGKPSSIIPVTLCGANKNSSHRPQFENRSTTSITSKADDKKSSSNTKAA